MNGNKHIAFLLVPLLMFSCGAFKKTVTEPEPPVVIETEPGPLPDSVITLPEESDIEEKYEVVEFKGQLYKVPIHKKVFNIAVILPFHVGAKTPEQRMRSDLMLEYYQGIQIALGDLNDLSSEYTVHVFDTKNDTSELKRILRRPEMITMDLIIGPTDDVQVRMAAFFARKNCIPLFSPVTIIKDAIIDNPYLFNLSPSDELQAQEFIRFYKKYHLDKKLIIIRDGKRFDNTFGEALITQLNNLKIKNFEVVSVNRAIKWDTVLSQADNLVLHLAEDKGTVNFTINSLVKYSDRVTLVGSDKWLDFTSMDYHFLSKLKVHFIGTNLSDIPRENSNLFKQKYRSLYNGDPSTFTYMGYDQFMFSCELLNAFGRHFPLFVMGKTFEYSNTRFNLVSSHHCYHNRFLQVIRYRDHQLVPVE